MGKLMILALVTGLAFGCENSVIADEGASATSHLTLQLNGVRGDQGNLVVAIFDSKEAFTQYEKPLAWVSVRAGINTIELHNFPVQKVAVAAFHDENENGQHDSQDNLPLEGWGNSGEISQWSEPTYEAALTSTGVVSVQMHYLN